MDMNLKCDINLFFFFFFWKRKQRKKFMKGFFLHWLMFFLWNHSTLSKRIQVAERASKMHHVLKVRAVTPETIDKVYMILFDRVKMREIAKTSQLSEFILFCIIKLNMKKLSKMDAAFAHYRAKANSYANISRLFGSV